MLKKNPLGLYKNMRILIWEEEAKTLKLCNERVQQLRRKNAWHTKGLGGLDRTVGEQSLN